MTRLARLAMARPRAMLAAWLIAIAGLALAAQGSRTG